MNFFTINIDFDRPERKGHEAKVPGSEMARERVGQGANRPVLLANSLRGANWPGSEKARYPRLILVDCVLSRLLKAVIIGIW